MTPAGPVTGRIEDSTKPVGTYPPARRLGSHVTQGPPQRTRASTNDPAGRDSQNTSPHNIRCQTRSRSTTVGRQCQTEPEIRQESNRNRGTSKCSRAHARSYDQPAELARDTISRTTRIGVSSSKTRIATRYPREPASNSQKTRAKSARGDPVRDSRRGKPRARRATYDLPFSVANR